MVRLNARPKSEGQGYVGWIDLAADDAAKAKQFLESFLVEDTIDALGFQPISDAFAERFYPGVTTPMTRARYFIFVPAVYEIVRRRRPENVGKAIEDLQIDLRRKLLKSVGRRVGVIGEKREQLIRYPSALYWTGLRKLGILKTALSEPALQSELYAGHASDQLTTDEGREGDSEGKPPQWWDEVPLEDVVSRLRIVTPTTLTLFRREADYLFKRFTESEVTSKSVIAKRLQSRDDAPREHVWTRPEKRFGSELRHARSFSAATRGASYVYEMLVIKKVQQRLTRRKIKLDDPGEGLATWWQLARPLVASWDVAEFTSLFEDHHGLVSDADRAFFALLRDASKESRYERFVQALEAPVVDREFEKRPRKSRLHRNADPKLLEQWRPSRYRDDRFLLAYRHRAGQTILRDVLRKPLLRSLDV